MLDSLFTATNTDVQFTFLHALLILGVAIVIGLIISVSYMKANPNNYTQSFTLTLVLLPTIVAIIILLIGSNIARAFSLAGAFSIIRFRSAPGNPKDIAYILFTMAAGLACGVGAFGYAVLFTILLCAMMYILSYVKFGVRKSSQKLLKVTIPESLNYQDAFDEVFKQFNVDYELKKIRTTDLGSLYELVYAITMSDDVNQKEFLDAIRCRNGNLDISLTLSPTEVEN